MFPPLAALGLTCCFAGRFAPLPQLLTRLREHQSDNTQKSESHKRNDKGQAKLTQKIKLTNYEFFSVSMVLPWNFWRLTLPETGETRPFAPKGNNRNQKNLGVLAAVELLGLELPLRRPQVRKAWFFGWCLSLYDNRNTNSNIFSISKS